MVCKSKIGEKIQTESIGVVLIIGYVDYYNCTIQFEDGTVIHNIRYDNINSRIKKQETSTKRIGEQHRTIFFGVVTIVDYIDSLNCSVKFEDGTVADNVEYHKIKHAQKPNHIDKHIGEQIQTRKWGVVSIINHSEEKKYTIQFEDGTTIDNLTYSRIKLAVNPKRGVGNIETNILTEDYGLVTVIEYTNKSNYTIQFEDGTILYNILYSNIKGNTKNPNQKITRVGEQHETLKHGKITILEYLDSRNCTVVFENDGTILNNIRYDSVKNGTISNPNYFLNERLGEINESNNGGLMEIIDYISADNCTIRFSDDTIVTNKKYSNFKNGDIKNPNQIESPIFRNRVGEILTSKNYGDVEIIEYFGSANCTVRFADGVIKKNVEYSHLVKGNVFNEEHHQNSLSYESMLDYVYKNTETKEFIAKSQKLWGVGFFNYDKTEYVNSQSLVIIGCREHGYFEQSPSNNLLFARGCRVCFNSQSKSEEELFNYIKTLYDGEIQNNVVGLLGDTRQEIDIYIPELKIGIEFNGLIWHSERFKKSKSKEVGAFKNYHKNKTILARENGIRLIHIWSDQWDFGESHESVESLNKTKLYLQSLFTQNNKRYYARKLELKQLEFREYANFLDKYHFQGGGSSPTIAYGLFDGLELIQLMSFTKSTKKNKTEEENKDYTLTRLCTKSGCVVIGGSERLFKKLKQSVDWVTIISHNNRDLFTGEIYKKLGFTWKSVEPIMCYTDGTQRFGRRNFQKQAMQKRVSTEINLKMLEHDIAREYFGVYRLYNSGTDTFVLNRTLFIV